MTIDNQIRVAQGLSPRSTSGIRMVFEVADLDRVKEIAAWYKDSWVFVSLAERYNRLEKLGYELAFRRRRNVR